MNNSSADVTKDPSTLGLVNALESSVYCFNFLFALPTHSYIIWLITRGTRSGIASDIFLLNLSFCELGICLDSLAFVLSMWFPCFVPADLFLVGLTFAGRPLFQCVMCVERYLAVVHPMTFLKLKPLRYRIFCCFVEWIIGLILCFYSLFILLTNNVQAHSAVFSVHLTVVLSIQLFCLLSVLRALKQSGPGERKEENHRKRRAFLIILITTVSMMLLYVPFTIAGYFTVATETHSAEVWLPGLVSFIVAGYVQPVLFLQRTRSFSFIHHICSFTC